MCLDPNKLHNAFYLQSIFCDVFSLQTSFVEFFSLQSQRRYVSSMYGEEIVALSGIVVFPYAIDDVLHFKFFFLLFFAARWV
jgi:hypothetical protein